MTVHVINGILLRISAQLSLQCELQSETKVREHFSFTSEEDIPPNIDAEEYEQYLAIDEEIVTEGVMTDSQLCDGFGA